MFQPRVFRPFLRRVRFGQYVEKGCLVKLAFLITSLWPKRPSPTLPSSVHPRSKCPWPNVLHSIVTLTESHNMGFLQVGREWEGRN